MTRAVLRTSAVSKQKATVYLRRGRNVFNAMVDAEGRQNSDGVATNGVRAAIALADAYTIAKLGLRSRSQDHLEVVRLISSIGTSKSAELAGRVQAILNRKQEVEYRERDVSVSDGARIASAVRKIRSLVESELA